MSLFCSIFLFIWHWFLRGRYFWKTIYSTKMKRCTLSYWILILRSGFSVVEHSPTYWLDVGSKPSYCHFGSFGITLNSNCLSWAEEFHQYSTFEIYVGWCLTSSSSWVSSWHSGFFPHLSAKWLKICGIGYCKGQVSRRPSFNED